MKIRHVRDYVEARRSEYPDIGEQLEAIWAVLKTQKLPKEAADILGRIEAVKRKYPKD